MKFLKKTAASEPSLTVCWRRAEATPRCTRQQTMAAQRWWSCCSRPMHRWMCKTKWARGLSSVTTCSGPSWRVTVCLEIGIHRSFLQKSHLLRQVSTSSVSRSEFFDLRLLNNLVSHLLILVLSKQNVLKIYGVSHNLGGANLLTQCVFSFAMLLTDLPQSFSRGDGVRIHLT